MELTFLSRAPAALGSLISVLVLLALTACAVGPNFHEPAPPATDRYTPDPQPSTTTEAPGFAGEAQTFSTERDVPGEWWTLFRSEPLDHLVRDALRDSPSVEAAKAALRSAEASYVAERGSLMFPAVDAQASATRERVPGASFGQPYVPASVFTLFNAAVNVSYRLDIFGGQRRQLEAQRALTEYQRWELEAAKLSLTGNIVTTAINVASLRAQIAAVNDIVSSERAQLQVVERQFQAGGASRADVLQQRSQLAQTEATVPALEKALAQAQHRLAVLAGHTPDVEALPNFDLDTLSLPGELPISVPAKLIRQRPDVQAAEAQLHQASAQIGVATANLLPQLNLSGLIGSEAVRARDLFGAGTESWSAGGSLLQPLFHGGELTARRRAAIANFDQAAAQYRQTVLAAMQEVADTLRALEADARDLKAQAAAESAAADSLEITKKQHQAGGVSYVTLLVAQRQYQQARQSRVQAEAARYADSAALLQALGGGWWNRKD